MPKQERMTSAAYKALLKAPPAAKGGSWRGRVAKPRTIDGIRFPSQIQGAVWLLLTLPTRQATSKTQMIVREPIFDLWSLAVDGKPGRYRPDFMLVKKVLSGPCQENYVVEIHEAKGSRAAESRDWKVRAAAAKTEYPFFDFYVWRMSGKNPRRMSLAEALS